MFAIALLAAVVPWSEAADAPDVTLPAFVRVEVERSATIYGVETGEPTTEAMETRVAADGVFYATIHEGDRTRTLSGTVEACHEAIGGLSHIVQVEYEDKTVTGSTPIGRGRSAPKLRIIAGNTSIAVRKLGDSATSQWLYSESLIDGKRVRESVQFTFRLLARPTPPHWKEMLEAAPATTPSPRPSSNR